HEAGFRVTVDLARLASGGIDGPDLIEALRVEPGVGQAGRIARKGREVGECFGVRRVAGQLALLAGLDVINGEVAAGGVNVADPFAVGRGTAEQIRAAVRPDLVS